MRFFIFIQLQPSWTSVVEAVDKIRNKHIKGNNLGQGHGFELLFLHMGLHLFDPKATDDAIKVTNTYKYEF